MQHTANNQFFFQPVSLGPYCGISFPEWYGCKQKVLWVGCVSADVSCLFCRLTAYTQPTSLEFITFIKFYQKVELSYILYLLHMD